MHKTYSHGSVFLSLIAFNPRNAYGQINYVKQGILLAKEVVSQELIGWH